MAAVAKILRVAARLANLPDGAIFSRKMDRHIVVARQVAYYVAHVHYGHTTVLIGMVAGRDHSTVVHGIHKIRGWLDRPVVRSMVERVVEQCRLEELPGEIIDRTVPDPPKRVFNHKRPIVPLGDRVVRIPHKETCDRVRSLSRMGHSVRSIAKLTGVDEMTVAAILGVEMWNGQVPRFEQRRSA